MNEQMRKEFEAWFKKAHTENVQRIDGEYTHGATERLWQAWQASRAAIVVELPTVHEDHYADEYTKACIDGKKSLTEEVQYALDKSGLSYK